MFKKITLMLCAALLLACDADIRIRNGDLSERLRFDFENGEQGWQAGFSDYDTELAAGFNLQSGVRSIPESNNSGFYLAGTNQSDDLFMFIKSRFRGLQASTRYVASVTINLVSNGGAGCAGIGGSPGESVYLKFGFAETEPQQAGYDLNVAKGNQSNGGANANVIGNIAVNGLACDGTNLGNKTVTSTSQTELEFTTTEDGRIWLFIGTDSGFEGRTEIYFDQIELTVQPKLGS